MKLSGQDAGRHIASPDPMVRATLIHGGDAMRIALRRRDLVAAIVGPQGEADMRITRLTAGDLREDRAALSDAVRARGFFPGPRAVVLDEATQHHAAIVAAVLADLSEEDAHLVVTAGAQKPGAALLAPFVTGRAAVAIAVYDDPPSAAEIAAILARAGLTDIAADAREALGEVARTMAPGEIEQLAEKIALYTLGGDQPVSRDDVAAMAPASAEAAVDDMMAVVSAGRMDRVGPVMTRLAGQGVTAVTLCIGAARHFRAIHALAVDPRARVFGANRDAIARDARRWGTVRSEQALRLLVETDLALRSSARAPQMALMERALLRLAQLGRR